MTGPPKRCFVHIGLPKTGTSFLQSILYKSKQALEEQDLTMLPHSRAATFDLHLDLQGHLRVGMDNDQAFGALARLPEQSGRVKTSRALITQEMFASATTSQVRRLIEHLPGWEIDLIITVRDLGRQLPSAWQERIKVRHIVRYEEFLEAARGRTPLAASFWNHHDLPNVLARWGSSVPSERIHVVTVPPPGSHNGQLLERFCDVIGVAAETLNTSTAEGNTSLGLVQAEVLRRVNASLGDRLPHPRAGYRRVGKEYLGRKVLGAQQGAPPLVPADLSDWCMGISRNWVSLLANGGYDICGDLDDLLPTEAAFSPDPHPASDSQIAESAIQALASMIDMRLTELKEVDALRRQLRDIRAEMRSLGSPAEDSRAGKSRIAGRALARAKRFARPRLG